MYLSGQEFQSEEVKGRSKKKFCPPGDRGRGCCGIVQTMFVVLLGMEDGAMLRLVRRCSKGVLPETLPFPLPHTNSPIKPHPPTYAP